MDEFTNEVIKLIGAIPKGKVMTYGSIAKFAGNPRGARQVSRILHSMSKKYGLPWHRVISSQGKISLPLEMGGDVQKERLISEGVEVTASLKINLDVYLWLND